MNLRHNSQVRRFATAAASFRERTEDRLLVVSLGDNDMVCIADGTGGASGGASAAQMFIAGVRRQTEASAIDLADARAWTAVLADLDQEIAHEAVAGETTGIALVVTPSSIVGASVGDSRAWLFAEGATELTRDQARKPRLIAGRATPRSFTAPATGALVVGTDGLFDHLPLAAIAAAAREPYTANGANTADALIGLLRARFRALPDDVAVVVGRLDNR